MKDISGLSAPLSRRVVLSTALAGLGLIGFTSSLSAGSAGAARIRAVAFDGDALLVTSRIFYRSDNGGVSWQSQPTLESPGIQALATHPDRPRRIIAGLAAGGIALSGDGGRNWEMRSEGLPREAVISLAVAAAQPDMIYAAVRGDGLWRSEDAGSAWTFVMDRPWLMQAERDPTALASVNLASGMGGIWIYAGTEAGLTRVPDCFCRWQEVQPDDAMAALASGADAPPEVPLPAGESIRALVSAPSAPQTLYAALPSGVWRSHDAGIVWSRVTRGHAIAIAVHPTSSEHILAAIDGGLMQSRNGGTTWTPLAVE